MGFDLFMGWDWSGLKGNERKGIGGLGDWIYHMAKKCLRGIKGGV